jgi:hypothetical protein
MVDLPAYPARFDFGRLFADAGRVLVREWLAITVGVIVLAGLPVAIADLPWWRGSPDTPLPTFNRVWAEVNLAKALVKIVAYSIKAVFVVAVSLKVLTGEPWREALRPRRWLVGVAVGLCLELLTNWPVLVQPFSTFYPPIAQVAWVLALGQLAVSILVSAWLGIAVTAAVAEPVPVWIAMARSVRLLRGLRWRMVSLSVAYLFLLGLAEYGVVLLLGIAHVSYLGPGLGHVAIGVAPLLPSAIFDAIAVSFFLQARRTADGPTVHELNDVFL